jgi:hypothetical protein
LGSTNNTRDEFIELLNISGSAVELFDPNFPTNTWRLSGGVDSELPPNLTLGAGEAALLVNFDPQTDAGTLAAFSAAYKINPGSVRIFGPYKGNLNNGGDHVAIARPDTPEPPQSPDAGVVPYILVDDVHYESQPPWPLDANASGKSLQRIAVSAFGDDPANWTAAEPTPGTAPVNTQPVFTAVGVQDGRTSLEFQATAGKTYSVLYSDVLGTGDWKKLADVPSQATSGPVSVSDRGFGSVPYRFYRVVTPALP